MKVGIHNTSTLQGLPRKSYQAWISKNNIKAYPWVTSIDPMILPMKLFFAKTLVLVWPLLPPFTIVLLYSAFQNLDIWKYYYKIWTLCFSISCSQVCLFIHMSKGVSIHINYHGNAGKNMSLPNVLCDPFWWIVSNWSEYVISNRDQFD